jgi:hypothetical protein
MFEFLIFLWFFQKHWKIFVPITIIIFLLLCYWLNRINKNKTVLQNDILNDSRFKNSKIFEAETMPIIISEDGYIAIIYHLTNDKKIININDINDFEVLIDNKTSSINTMGISIGLFFGSIGKINTKINSIKLILKMNNFNEPIIEIPFLSHEINTDSNSYYNIQEKIIQLTGTLEYLINKNKVK